MSASNAGRPVILRAPPGAGKTTGVPPALLANNAIPQGRILLLQPRRLAARSAAHRLAQLASESLGATYGYHVRFDRKVSDKTRLIAMTTGILLRQLTSDPLLEDVGCVILDEFHERSLEMDLALGMLQRIRTTMRPELRIIVMSATLDTQPVERLIDDAVTIESLGKAFPVDVRYEDTVTPEAFSSPAGIARSVSNRVAEALTSTGGDILVFLPGVGEIERTANLLADLTAARDLEVCKLYGDLSPAEQDRVLAPADQRKIVLATNIAETSITIPGITCVIDSGLARVLEYDAAVGVPCLRLQPISKASADQRAGRAGRTTPGICFRLWSRTHHRSRPQHTLPEVARADLSSAILMLAAWGERDVAAFPWITPPADHAIQAATHLLVQLGAVNNQRVVNELGMLMNRLPLHPRLARWMIAAVEFDCLEEASLAAAMLSERDPFSRSSGQVAATDQTACESDLIDRVVRLQRHFAGERDAGIHSAIAGNVSRVAKQLRRSIENEAPKTDEQDLVSMEERLSRALLAAYPDRLAKRRSPDSASGLMVGGRGVKLDRSSAVRTSNLLVCVSVDGKGEEARVRIASGVAEDWLPEERISTRRECFFHPQLKAVVARSRRYFLDLPISESPVQCVPDQETAELLYGHAERHLQQILPAEHKSLHSFFARWQFLIDQGHLAELPSDVETALRSILREFCRTRTSLKELSSAPWLEHLKGMFSYEQLKWMDGEAPESIVVPSGNRIRVDYQPGKPPVLAVRIQEIYGWRQTPRLASGRVPLQLHLLGPNYRPQQITDDLESFWATTYGVIKKELKRRYSKHHWPDDPTTAVATANGLKPKSE